MHETPDKSIATLNALDAATAQTALTRCCGARRWVARILAQRPFADRTHLLGMADTAWWDLTADDWHEAFAHHPKIGDIDSMRARFANTQALSAREQAGVQGVSEAVLQSLAEGNQAYEAKFGYIFIVYARGKSAAEMLRLLHQRLAHDPQTELPIAAEEQRQIMQLRLQAWLEELAADV